MATATKEAPKQRETFAPPEKKHELPAHGVGLGVVYYPAGSQATGVAAVITDKQGDGLVRLTLWYPDRAEGVPKHNVHHVDHCVLADKPKIAINFGTWDTWENHELRRQIQSEAEVEAARRRETDARAREERLLSVAREHGKSIDELYAQGLDAQGVAARLGGSWTADKVVIAKRRYAEWKKHNPEG